MHNLLSRFALNSQNKLLIEEALQKLIGAYEGEKRKRQEMESACLMLNRKLMEREKFFNDYKKNL